MGKQTFKGEMGNCIAGNGRIIGCMGLGSFLMVGKYLKGIGTSGMREWEWGEGLRMVGDCLEF